MDIWATCEMPKRTPLFVCSVQPARHEHMICSLHQEYTHSTKGGKRRFALCGSCRVCKPDCIRQDAASWQLRAAGSLELTVFHRWWASDATAGCYVQQRLTILAQHKSAHIVVGDCSSRGRPQSKPGFICLPGFSAFVAASSQHRNGKHGMSVVFAVRPLLDCAV